MLKRILGAVLALLVLAVAVMAVIESMDRIAARQASIEMREAADSIGAAALPDSLPAVVDPGTH